jgi:hypothetical protein
MKIVYGLLGVLFGTFAFFQLNDPDPFIWVVIFGVVSLISILRLVGFFHRSLTLVILLLVGLFTLLHAPYFWEWAVSNEGSDLFGSMNENLPYLEGTREFLGLIMADLALAFHLYWKNL